MLQMPDQAGAVDHEEIKEEGFLTRPPFTLPSSTRPGEAKRMMNPGEYVMRLGLKSSVRSRVVQSEGLGGHARFAWNGAPF